ncbi:hypothetical protein DENIS_0376 [Desulfonema ishimotonii]|uniref:Uncharacterized protein n=1 Tax=Desulfonema ishimotonii TaxID=45657 RepID=A0A401FR46_9BACT|nr:hypothetical protein [Desulfonema ishimotonii]GBC59437.1 hypothetical protein DENIS_0376 [Desulfonema ishimotonii]
MTRNALVAYNRSLDDDSVIAGLSEGYIEKQIDIAGKLCPDHSEAGYWLTIARITELTLLCAGNYADHCEFCAAGDLLVNPRKTDVHLRYGSEPVIKHRHRALTDQFQDVASERSEVIEWLVRETVVRIQQKPLLPYLFEMLKNSGRMSETYLRSVDRRMKAVADAMAILATCHIPEYPDIYQYLQYARPSQRAFIESRLCRFDREIFFQIGQDIYQHVEENDIISGFLR